MFSGLGVSLFLAGLVVVALAWAVLRFFPRSQSNIQPAIKSFVFPEVSKSSSEATVILQPGGRVEHISALARSYFELRENEAI
jgi:hypothetical protein